MQNPFGPASLDEVTLADIEMLEFPYSAYALPREQRANVGDLAT